MRRFLVFLAAVVAMGCGRQAEPLASSRPPLAVPITGSSAHPDLHVQQIVVRPQTVPQGQPGTISVRLNRTDSKATVRVNWFDPSGWSVAEAQSPASSREITFTVPPRIRSAPGHYRAEVMTGNSDQDQGQVTLDVTAAR